MKTKETSELCMITIPTVQVSPIMKTRNVVLLNQVLVCLKVHVYCGNSIHYILVLASTPGRIFASTSDLANN